ncbi:MAG: hypothetical protein M3Q09_02610, partial [Gemmatimonadota bacterium]|nr:hypothetical protein [Gemmatimonadota bacterium]
MLDETPSFAYIVEQRRPVESRQLIPCIAHLEAGCSSVLRDVGGVMPCKRGRGINDLRERARHSIEPFSVDVTRVLS